MNNISKNDFNRLWKTFCAGAITFFKRGGWFFFLMFFLDLGTKLGMNAYFGNPNTPLHPDIVLLPNTLSLTLTYNTGAAYGTGANLGPTMRILFACVSFIAGSVIIYLLVKYFKRLNDWKLYAIYLILAGDWGNFIDRAFYWNRDGIYGVIDWIAVGGDGWPSFLRFVCNWADVCLTVGAIMFVLIYLIEWIQEKNNEKKNESDYLAKKEQEEEGGSYLTAEKRMYESQERKTETPQATAENKPQETDLSNVLKNNGAMTKKEESKKEERAREKREEDYSSLSDFLKGDK